MSLTSRYLFLTARKMIKEFKGFVVCIPFSKVNLQMIISTVLHD
jgi:hypothetical protein